MANLGNKLRDVFHLLNNVIHGTTCRVNLIGHAIGRKVPVEIGKAIWKTLRLSGSGGTTNWFPRTIRFMSKIVDKYDFVGLVSHYYKFEDLAEATERCPRGCSHMGPPADPECAWDELDPGTATGRRVVAVRKLLGALRSNNEWEM